MATGLGLCSTDSDTNRQDSSPRPSIPIDRASFFNLLNLNGVHRPGSIYDAEIWAGSAEHVPQTNSLPHPWRRRRAGVSLKDGSVHWRRTHVGDSKPPAEAPTAASSLSNFASWLVTGRISAAPSSVVFGIKSRIARLRFVGVTRNDANTSARWPA